MSLNARLIRLLTCTLLAVPFATAQELEQSASAPDMVREQAYTSVDSRFGALKAATEVLMQTQLTYLTSIKNCGAQRKLWNGSACVDALADSLTLTAPRVVMNAVSVEGQRSYYQQKCCKKVWGACVRDKHWHTQVYCTQSPTTDYTVSVKTNTVTITQRTCNPRIIWAC